MVKAWSLEWYRETGYIVGREQSISTLKMLRLGHFWLGSQSIVEEFSTETPKVARERATTVTSR